MDANTWHINRAIVGCQGMTMVDYNDWINALLKGINDRANFNTPTHILLRSWHFN
jgi:hypothetical protein